jgi:beta-mannanase
LALSDVRFGLSAPQVPYSVTEVNRLATLAGARPTILQHFTKWNEDFRPDAARASYQQGALPIVSWEPWEGNSAGANQPKYSLASIASGKHDMYITKFATAVRDQKYPVAIRLAHEMNGNWYPWSERRSGNKQGDYVKAWRHVYEVFEKADATNVIWIWSPNILRPVPKVSLNDLYPGDEYVDWIGVVGYAVGERTASEVFQPTLTALRKFSKKPVIITETGVEPGAGKVSWITDFFTWLASNKDVIGFVWFEYSKQEGGTADWRFSATTQSVKAFSEGLAGVTLAPAPIASP